MLPISKVGNGTNIASNIDYGYWFTDPKLKPKMPKLPKVILDYSAQESVAPYIKAVVATTSTQDACRAVHMKGTAADVTLTIGGDDIVFHLLKGHTYPICATKSSSTSVVLLY